MRGAESHYGGVYGDGQRFCAVKDRISAMLASIPAKAPTSVKSAVLPNSTIIQPAFVSEYGLKVVDTGKDAGADADHDNRQTGRRVQDAGDRRQRQRRWCFCAAGKGVVAHWADQGREQDRGDGAKNCGDKKRAIHR